MSNLRPHDIARSEYEDRWEFRRIDNGELLATIQKSRVLFGGQVYSENDVFAAAWNSGLLTGLDNGRSQLQDELCDLLGVTPKVR